jgi:hypothetical protein
MLAAGSVVADENGALSSRTFTAAEADFNLDYGNDRIAEYAVDDRIIDRLRLFDRSDDGGSGQYSVSLDVEKEDSDWSFEVTVTMEF